MSPSNAGRAGVAPSRAKIAEHGRGGQGQGRRRRDAAALRGAARARAPRGRAHRQDRAARPGREPQYPLPLPRIASSRSLRSSRRGSSVSDDGEQRLQTLLLAERLEQLLLERGAEVDGRGEAERQRPVAGRFARRFHVHERQHVAKDVEDASAQHGGGVRLGVVVVVLDDAAQVLRLRIVRLAQLDQPKAPLALRRGCSCGRRPAVSTTSRHSAAAAALAQASSSARTMPNSPPSARSSTSSL